MKISKSEMKKVIKECLVEEAMVMGMDKITDMQNQSVKTALDNLHHNLPDEYSFEADYAKSGEPGLVKYAQDEETPESVFLATPIGGEFFEPMIDNETFNINELLINDPIIDELLEDYGVSEAVEYEELDQFIRELGALNGLDGKVLEIVTGVIESACKMVFIEERQEDEEYMPYGLINVSEEADMEKLLKSIDATKGEGFIKYN